MRNHDPYSDQQLGVGDKERLHDGSQELGRQFICFRPQASCLSVAGIAARLNSSECISLTCVRNAS